MPVRHLLFGSVISVCLIAWGAALSDAHEGHDHDKPPPLALPVAPRVVAVTPDYELVGVASGKGRLSVFLHSFATNEPVRGASMTVFSGDRSAEANPEGDGVFNVIAPWLDLAGDLELVFALKLADGGEDLLTGTFRGIAAQAAISPARNVDWQLASLAAHLDRLIAGSAGLVAGILLMLLIGGRRASNGPSVDETAGSQARSNEKIGAAPVGPSPRLVRTLALILFGAVAFRPESVQAADARATPFPAVPSTMATDLAQRLPDGTLFVPKATQHLLSIRTLLTAEGASPIATELTGTIVPGPANFGRVQPGRPGRIEATPDGLAYVGKRVEKGDLLAYVQPYIEAADRANMDSLIAETEARIEKNRTILGRYMVSPGAVPQVRVDEVRGELDALKRKREELLPSIARREPVAAPISGVVSLSNASIGQIVEARDVLFEIIDPSELWVEAHGHNHEATALKAMTAAFAIDPHGHRLALELAGRGLALRHQASISTFKIIERHDSLAVGMPVKVVIQSNAGVNGVVLPASAVIRGQTGLPVVWVKTDAERFETQVVKTAPLDGQSIVVTAGLKAEKRVVIDGATLLDQVR